MARQVFGFVLVFLILLGAFVSCERLFSPSFKECLAKHQAQNTSGPAKENPSGFSGSASTYVECTGSFIDANNGAITALATMVIAAFTSTLWRATTRQSDLTREALIADRQAFVFTDSLTGFWESDGAGHYNWRFRPIWKNSGDTPTRDLRFRTNCELRNNPMPLDFTFPQNDQPGTGLIGPKSSAQGGLAPHPGAAISAQDLVDVQKGNKCLYLWGWARYNDVFPDTPQHITHFCWAIIPNGDPLTFLPGTSPDVFRLDHILYDVGNYTRDE